MFYYLSNIVKPKKTISRAIVSRETKKIIEIEVNKYKGAKKAKYNFSNKNINYRKKKKKLKSKSFNKKKSINLKFLKNESGELKYQK